MHNYTTYSVDFINIHPQLQGWHVDTENIEQH